MHEHEHEHQRERVRAQRQRDAEEQATAQANNERTLAVLEGTQVQPRHHSHSQHTHTHRHTHPSSIAGSSTSRQPLPQHASHSNLPTSSSTSSTAEQQEQLFSPITSDGSVISMGSSSTAALSIHASPDSTQRKKHAAEVKQREEVPEQTREREMDEEDTTMQMDTKEEEGQGQNEDEAEVESKPQAVFEQDAARAVVNHANPSSANPRKSARRHSDNGMKTPDEAIYASRNYHLTSTQTPSAAYPVDVHLANALPSTSSSTSHTEEAAAAAKDGKNGSLSKAPSALLTERLHLDSSVTAPLMTGRTASGPATFPSNLNGDNHSNQLKGDTAVAGSSAQNVPFASAPLEGATSYTSASKSAAGMIIPGERRIQNEEMRPARRKVHRVDTGNQQRQTFSHSNSNLMDGYVHTPMPDDAHVQADENRRHLVQEKTDHHGGVVGDLIQEVIHISLVVVAIAVISARK
jgi:hypothetical protein